MITFWFKVFKASLLNFSLIVSAPQLEPCQSRCGPSRRGTRPSPTATSPAPLTGWAPRPSPGGTSSTLPHYSVQWLLHSNKGSFPPATGSRLTRTSATFTARATWRPLTAAGPRAWAGAGEVTWWPPPPQLSPTIAGTASWWPVSTSTCAGRSRTSGA